MWDQKNSSLKLIFIGFLIVLIGTNLVTYFMFGFNPSSPGTAGQEQEAVDHGLLLTDPSLLLFMEALELITEHYVEPVERATLVEGAIEGLIEAIKDQRTTFYNARALENFLIQTRGTFGGIGVRIVEVDGRVVVFETIPGTPAEKAGLYPGDRIRSAAGEDLSGQGLDRAVELLRGPRGTSVIITLERPGSDEEITLTLKRDDVQMVSVNSRMLDKGPGYIQINNFDSFTGSAFAVQLSELEAQGLEQGLVLDLRNNPGGLMDEAIKVARLLVPEGEITRVVARGDVVRDIYRSSARAKPYPIVVLVNEETASAAEIVAGALQDHGAASLVGVKTYGKATVQHLEMLSGGNALLLTVAKYLTPSGRDINGKGIEPDYHVEMPVALQSYRRFLPVRLEEGDYGAEVMMLQDMLIEIGYQADGEGIFNQATAAALLEFQIEAGLEPSGYFDDLTWIHLRQALELAARQRDPQLQFALELLS